MKSLPLIVLSALLGLATASQAATPGSLQIKARVAYLETADESDAFSALGIDFAADAISVEDKWIPEIDITYAFTRNLVAELVLTVPQQHDVYLAGVGKLGSLEHLPPTLSLIYEFTNKSPFVPYLSAGLNYTWITNKRLNVAGVNLDLDDDSLGLAFGAGLKYNVDERWDLDLSAKWIDLDSDVTAGGAKLTTASLNPFVFSFGAAYRF